MEVLIANLPLIVATLASLSVVWGFIGLVFGGGEGFIVMVVLPWVLAFVLFVATVLGLGVYNVLS